MKYTNDPSRKVLNNNEQHLVDNKKTIDLTEKSEIIDRDKYTVELASDVTIPEIEENLVEKHKDITGYTAGLITKDLVTMGEEMLKKKKE